MNDLQRFEKYLIDRYGVVQISKAVKEKLSSAIRNGVQISVLHELFKLDSAELDKINENNIKKGNRIEGTRLLLYDLAVILDRYPAYKRKKDAIARQSEELLGLDDMRVMVENVKHIPKKKNELRDVSSLVDEIFFS